MGFSYRETREREGGGKGTNDEEDDKPERANGSGEHLVALLIKHSIIGVTPRLPNQRVPHDPHQEHRPPDIDRSDREQTGRQPQNPRF